MTARFNVDVDVNIDINCNMSSSGRKSDWKDGLIVYALRTHLSMISPAELETIKPQTWVESLTALVVCIFVDSVAKGAYPVYNSAKP